ncbi:putative Radical SAM domain protein [Desulfamplus magnetovallimortis]|uniref:Putative Radical SAM domain protein n=1 Tax=Desulfamplus magnetovallimortis TaxID=1246637 RepID=A0A1W1HED7_9BACT|nr:radical SAM protein [Desulfamplus magnetovallimortis]SLM30742.1 putative Radical SAM domain protein [Desulfamplus magnetovallimortis]
MRAAFVFPPKAGATYIPLGIASLAPYIESHVPDAEVHLIDLNIALWLRLASSEPEGSDLIAFTRGKTGQFLDPVQTSYYKKVWDRLRRKMTLLGEQANLYLATGEASGEFLSILDTQIEQILGFEPGLIGISVLFPEQLPFAAALARAVKNTLGVKGIDGVRIVLGGAMMSAMPATELLEAIPEIDAVVCGEGEEAAAALCLNRPHGAIPGLIYREGNTVRSNIKAQTLSLKQIPAPDFSKLPLYAYFNPVPVLPVLFSRGCAWRRCRFCAHNFSFSGYRKKDIRDFVAEMADYTRRLGVHHFYFADEYILPKDMDGICQEIMAQGLFVNFHILGKPTADCTKARLALWSAAGCRWIGWGVETGSQRLLDLINKGTCVGDMDTVIHNSASVGISNLGLMIFGLPTSTEADLELTMDFLSRTYNSFGGLTASAFVLFEKTYFARNADRFAMHIDEAMPLIYSNKKVVKSYRLKFREIAWDGSLRTPRGAIEVARWQQFRKWLGDTPFLELLPTEHYLIHVSSPEFHMKEPAQDVAEAESI